jgi:hypothetical protein
LSESIITLLYLFFQPVVGYSEGDVFHLALEEIDAKIRLAERGSPGQSYKEKMVYEL